MTTNKFDKALEMSQAWVDIEGVIAVGESKDDEGNQVIMVFSSLPADTLANILPKEVKGFNVVYYNTGEVRAQDQQE